MGRPPVGTAFSIPARARGRPPGPGGVDGAQDAVALDTTLRDPPAVADRVGVAGHLAAERRRAAPESAGGRKSFANLVRRGPPAVIAESRGAVSRAAPAGRPPVGT